MSINECREIYREAFGSDGEFENRLFTCCFKYCRTLSIGGKTASMLFALPCNIHNAAAPVPAYYIFAAATKKEFRGNGYMSRLIRSLEARFFLFVGKRCKAFGRLCKARAVFIWGDGKRLKAQPLIKTEKRRGSGL